MQIERWADVYRSSSPLPVPLLEEGAAWLHHHAPPLERVGVVHGDPGPGNFVHDGHRVLAFTDWEFTHLGDPTEDWSFLLSMRGSRTMPQEDWLTLIRDEAGVEVQPEHMHYWQAFNFFKGACANRSCLQRLRHRQPRPQHGAHRHRPPTELHAPDGRPHGRLTTPPETTPPTRQRTGVSDMRLDGQTAVVTGGTRGIGRGIAEIYLEHGANVVVNGRSPEKGEEAIKEMGGGENVHFIQGDVMKKDDVEAIVDGAHERYGRVDILVNNAGGITGHGMIADMDDWAWLGTIEWNLNAAFYATRRALKYMVPQGSGRIINISSVEGKQANKPAVSNYITTKHALNGLTKATAFEYGPMGITCNAICPGRSRPTSCGSPGLTPRLPPASPTSSSSRATPTSR